MASGGLNPFEKGFKNPKNFCFGFAAGVYKFGGNPRLGDIYA